MQNTEATVAGAGTPGVIEPPGEPVSVMVRHVDWPKQPGVPGVPPWPVQKFPAALVRVELPVVSGDRLTLIGPTCVPSRQESCPLTPAWQSQGEEPVPFGQFVAAELPPVRQSRVRPTELVDVQAI